MSEWNRPPDWSEPSDEDLTPEQELPEGHPGIAVKDTMELAPLPDLSSVDYAVRRVGELNREEAHMLRYYEEEKLRLDSWMRRERARLVRRRAWLEMRIGKFLEDQERTTGKSSLRLPMGTVSFRAHPASLAVLDEPAFIEWARQHERPEFLRLSTTVSLSGIRPKVNKPDLGEYEAPVVDLQTGEVLPGVKWHRPTLRDLYVKPAGALPVEREPEHMRGLERPIEGPRD